MSTLLKRYQIIIFFVLTFIISWLPWYATGKPNLLAWVPAVVGLVMVVVVGGKQGLREWISSALRWRVGIKWWILAIFGLGILMILAVGLTMLLGNEPPQYSIFKEELWLLPLYFLIIVLFGSLGEELGWRGYALPHLQSKYNPLVASVIIGFLWGLWHLPMFFNPSTDKYTQGLIFIIPFIFGCIGNSLLMTWIYNRTKGSTLVAGITWHAALNFWTAVLLVSNFSIMAANKGEIVPRITPLLYNLVEVLLILAGLAIILITKGRLGLAVDAKK